MLERRLLSLALLQLCLSLAACGEEAVPVCGETTCGAAQPDDETPPGLEPGEGAIVDPSGAADFLLDLGRIVVGVERRASVPLVNRGEAAVLVEVERPPAPFVLFHAPNLLKPGATGGLEFTWRPERSGSSEAIVTIAAGGRSLRLRLVGEAFDAALDCPASLEAVHLSEAGVVETVRCTNPTDLAFGVVASVEGPFVLDHSRHTVAPGDQVDFVVAPASLDAATVAGALVIDGPAGQLARVPLQLTLQSGPRISCAQPEENPIVPVGYATTLSIVCTNVGETATSGITAQVSDEAITADVQADTVAPGASFDVDLTFEPSRQGSIAAILELTTSPLEKRWRVDLRATALELPPCEILLEPEAALDFAEVEPGGTYLRELLVRAAGENVCFLRDLRIEGDPAVWRIEPALDGELVLEPWESRRFAITYSPEQAGEHAATLRFRHSGPVWPERTLALTGRAAASCLTLDPPVVDFGEVLGACPVDPATVLLRNDCGEAVVVSSLDTAGEGAFSIDAQPQPISLAPGEGAQVAVHFVPGAEGPVYGGALIAWSGAEAPRFLPLLGERAIDSRRSQTFVAPDYATDILLVIDNGGGLQPQLTGELDELLFRAAANDWRIGITTASFGACTAPAAGTLTTILDPTLTDLHAQFDAAVQPDVCAGTTRLFAAALAALDPAAGFVRPEAQVVVIFVTAGDDADTTAVDDVLQQLRLLGNHPRLFAHAIFPATSCGGTTDLSQGTRTASLVEALGGAAVGVCRGREAAREIGDAGFLTPERLPLSAPALESTHARFPPEGMEVRIDGTALSPINGSVDVWRHLPALNVVEIHPLYRPEPGAQVEIRWVEACVDPGPQGG